MTELSPGARALIDAAREVGGPSAVERAALKAALDARIAAEGAVASGSAAVGGAAASKLALVAVLAGGAVMGGVWWERQSRAGSAAVAVTEEPQQELVQPAADPEPILSPAVAEPPPAVAEPVPPPEPDRARDRVRRRDRSPPRADEPSAPVSPPPVEAVPIDAPVEPVTSPPLVDTLAAELVLIGAAEEALARGQHAESRAALARHALEHPSGALVEERTALQILIDCAGAHDASTTARAATFIAARRGTPVATRIAAACRLDPPTSAP